MSDFRPLSSTMHVDLLSDVPEMWGHKIQLTRPIVNNYQLQQSILLVHILNDIPMSRFLGCEIVYLDTNLINLQKIVRKLCDF